MDEIVEAALRKWPNVPHAYGWLALDARGDWYLRDEAAQAAGPFPQVKGSRIVHEKLRAFIERNYAHDDAGAWFFQNGPQRVYADLEAAPLVWRLDAGEGGEGGEGPIRLTAHDGRPAVPRIFWVDEHGRLFIDADIGFGVVHTLDMPVAEPAVARGDWQPQEATFAELVERYGYRLRPAAS